MISSIRSQSMALRSSHSPESSSSSEIIEDSEIHRGTLPNCAMGVSPSPGGPGGGGRIGRGRTRSGARGNAVTDPSSMKVEYTRNRGVGVAEDGLCGGVGGSITWGRCGRAVDDDAGDGERRDTGTVCGGDHAGGGDLGRGGGEGEGRGRHECPKVASNGGGGDFGILGSGRDLPKELVVGLIWITIVIKSSDSRIGTEYNTEYIRTVVKEEVRMAVWSRRWWVTGWGTMTKTMMQMKMRTRTHKTFRRSWRVECVESLGGAEDRRDHEFVKLCSAWNRGWRRRWGPLSERKPLWRTVVRNWRMESVAGVERKEVEWWLWRR
jgi:hypothetical protein